MDTCRANKDTQQEAKKVRFRIFKRETSVAAKLGTVACRACACWWAGGTAPL